MARGQHFDPDGVTDPDAGVWNGNQVAHRAVSPDGFAVLVGRTAADNDILTFKLASPRDFWLHAAGVSGSHVVVRNPEGVTRLPRETQRFAASLAAGHSKAAHGGRVAVHLCRCRDVSKPRGMAPGKVTISRFQSVRAAPRRINDSA